LYNKSQGALFAKNLAMLSGATSCSEKENDYEYEKGIIYENHDEDGNSTETGNMIVKLFIGRMTEKIDFITLANLLGSASVGKKIEQHYLAFPDSPARFEAWVKKANKIWRNAGSMADVAEEDLQKMLAAEQNH
jgi:hypothetical protein